MTVVQIVMGSAGSGKTTYCRGMKEFLTGIGRKCEIVNLDPTNEIAEFSDNFAVDVRELVDVFSVCCNEKIGPNGALLWALEHVAENVPWLVDQLQILKLTGVNTILIDCPGQIEIYCNSNVMQKIVAEIANSLEVQIIIVNLMESFFCSELSTFIAGICASLSVMVSFDFPFFHVLSKADLLEDNDLPVEIDELIHATNLSHFVRKYAKGRQKILLELLGDYIESNLSFSCNLLNIQDKVSVSDLMKKIDCAIGIRN